jgi:hypothetical protein
MLPQSLLEGLLGRSWEQFSLRLQVEEQLLQKGAFGHLGCEIMSQGNVFVRF